MLKKSDINRMQDAYWCVVSGTDIFLVDDSLPRGEAKQWQLPEDKAIMIGELNNTPVMWVNESECTESFDMISLRDCLHLSESLFLLLSKAVQYGHMSDSMRFCPQCGGRNHMNHNQLAMQCGECRTLHYPRIFPCVIVAVRNQQQILLAQHPRHKTGMYTVIAGFLEVGETLEQCVAREVLEETGICVKNIRYFGSQPWAFPSSMMMGFLADYDSGVIKPDYSELSDAQWFKQGEMPEVAPQGTIARALIEQTLSDMKN